MNESASWIFGLFLLGLSAFLVMAEYALISVRRSRIDSLASSGSRSARALLSALDKMPRVVAAIQIGITVCGLALGASMEPLLSDRISRLVGSVVNPAISSFLAILVVTFVTVVAAELVPKYLALAISERLALAIVRPLGLIVLVLSPIAMVAQWSANLMLRPFGIKPGNEGEGISRDELALLLRAGESAGILEETHANVVSKALRFDKLDAADIMIHRIDIKWINLDASFDQMVKQLSASPHSRVPVCRGDIDDIAGMLYLHDVVKRLENPPDTIEELLRPIEVVPENINLNKIIERMRESRTQILIVVDEYGGTSGLITLEDVIEEVFGELEDALEAERPMIEELGLRRISARAEVRVDEVFEFFDMDASSASTDTLAQVVVDQLQRIPRPGDKVEMDFGTLIVENMARRRVTRVRVHLTKAQPESE